jgi:hypothetical protein
VLERGLNREMYNIINPQSGGTRSGIRVHVDRNNAGLANLFWNRNRKPSGARSGRDQQLALVKTETAPQADGCKVFPDVIGKRRPPRSSIFQYGKQYSR